jgi:L-malate glycosyltransferase
MRICFLADVRSVHTRRWASHFVEQGCDVHVVSFSRGDIPSATLHFTRAVKGLRPVSYMLAAPRVRRLLELIKPDVVHSHYVTSYGLVGALIGVRPHIATAWGTDVLVWPQKSRLAKSLVRWTLKRADLITSMARHMTEVIGSLGIPMSRIITLPFGVDTRIFHPGLHQWDAETIDVVCTRALEPVYDLDTLIRALPIVRARFAGFRCLLLGRGSRRHHLERLARNLHVDSHIRWLGQLDQPSLATWLGQSRVFVSTSRSDGNNISLNEAMACGCFPVVSDIPANREWIEGDRNGALVPLGRSDLVAEGIIEGLSSRRRPDVAAANWEIIRDRGDWHKNIRTIEEHYELMRTSRVAVS